MAVAFDEPALFSFTNCSGDVVRPNARCDELALRSLEITVLAPAMSEMLDHEEVDHPTGINAQRAPCITFEKLARHLDELLFRVHRRPHWFTTSSQSVFSAFIGGGT